MEEGEAYDGKGKEEADDDDVADVDRLTKESFGLETFGVEGEEEEDESDIFLDLWIEGFSDYLTKLPNKLLCNHIFAVLSAKDLCAMDLVCQKIHKIIREDKALWESLSRRDYYELWLEMKQDELSAPLAMDSSSSSRSNSGLSVTQKRRREASRRKSTTTLAMKYDDNDENKWRSAYIQEASRVNLWRTQVYSFHLLYRGGLYDTADGYMISSDMFSDVVELWDLEKHRHLTALMDSDDLRIQKLISDAQESSDLYFDEASAFYRKEPQHDPKFSRNPQPVQQSSHGFVESLKMTEHLAICGYSDGYVVIYNADTRGIKTKFNAHPGKGVKLIEVVKNLVFTSAAGSLKIWNIHHIYGTSPAPLFSLDYPPDSESPTVCVNQLIVQATSCSRSTMNITLVSAWDTIIRIDLLLVVIEGGGVRVEWANPEKKSFFLETHNVVTHMACCNSIGVMASLSANDDKLVLWKLPVLHNQSLISAAPNPAPSVLANCSFFHQEIPYTTDQVGKPTIVLMNEQLVIAGTSKGTLLVWDVISGNFLYSMRRDQSEITSMTLRGMILFTGSSTGAIRIVSLIAKRPLFTLYHPDSLADTMAPIKKISVWSDRVVAINDFDLMCWRFHLRVSSETSFYRNRKKPRSAFAE